MHLPVELRLGLWPLPAFIQRHMAWWTHSGAHGGWESPKALKTPLSSGEGEELTEVLQLFSIQEVVYRKRLAALQLQRGIHRME